jgi:metallopeptidase MepB
MAASAACPVIGLYLRLHPEDIANRSQEILSDHSKALDQICSTNASERNFASTFAALALADSKAAQASADVVLPSLVASGAENASVRTASAEAKTRLKQMWADAYSRKDLFSVLQSVVKSKDTGDWGPEGARLIDLTMQMFEQNGVYLDTEKFEKFSRLRTQVSQQCSQFEQNLSNDNTGVEFTEQELNGAPAAFLGRLKRTEDSKLLVGCKAPEFVPVMVNAEVRETRRRMKLAADTRCVETVSIVKMHTMCFDQCHFAIRLFNLSSFYFWLVLIY